MILFVGKDTTLFRSSPIRYRGWLYVQYGVIPLLVSGTAGLLLTMKAELVIVQKKDAP